MCFCTRHIAADGCMTNTWPQQDYAALIRFVTTTEKKAANVWDPFKRASFFLVFFFFCALKLKREFFRNYYSHVCNEPFAIHKREFILFAAFTSLPLWNSVAMADKAKRLFFECHCQRGKYSLFGCRWRRAQLQNNHKNKQLVCLNRVDVS